MSEVGPMPAQREAARESPSALAVELAVKLVAGAGDAETMAWLRSGLLRWIRSDGALPLSSVLHLGASPRRVRLVIRDQWLVEAARYVGGASPWERARELARAVEHFLAYRWPAWRKLDEPPANATAIEYALFGAAWADPDLPRSSVRLYRITAQIAERAK